MDRIVHGVAKSWTQLSNFHFHRVYMMLKLQYFDHLMQGTDSLEKTLMLGKRMRWLDGITDSMDMSLSKLWEIVDGHRSLACCPPCRKGLDVTWRLNNKCIHVSAVLPIEPTLPLLSL